MDFQQQKLAKILNIGETVNTRKALKLCKHFKLDYLVKRIKENPKAFKSWVFDG